MWVRGRSTSRSTPPSSSAVSRTGPHRRRATLPVRSRNTREWSARPPRAPSRRDALMTWWRDSVIYQIYPRSFADSNGDGIGDLQGVIGKLDHLAWLGVDAIWLSPVMASPNTDWGYDVADYCDVHPELGSLADFDALITA